MISLCLDYTLILCINVNIEFGLRHLYFFQDRLFSCILYFILYRIVCYIQQTIYIYYCVCYCVHAMGLLIIFKVKQLLYGILFYICKCVSGCIFKYLVVIYHRPGADLRRWQGSREIQRRMDAGRKLLVGRLPSDLFQSSFVLFYHFTQHAF